MSEAVPPKKSSKLLWILGGLVLLGLVCCGTPALLIGALGVGAHQQQVEQEKKVQEDKPLVVSAEELVSAYRENKAAAEKTYKDKVVEVSGAVGKIEKDYVELDTPNAPIEKGFDLLRIHLQFKDDKVLADLARGQALTVKGLCTGVGLFDAIYVEKCVMAK